MKHISTIITSVIFAAMMLFCSSHEQMYVPLIRVADCRENAVVAETNPAEEACEHSFGEFILVVLPTPDTPGVEVRTCSNCQSKEERTYICEHTVIPNETVIEPTCSTEGLREISCSLCDCVLATEILESLPHAETYPNVIQEPTCYSEGLEAIICTECNQTIEEHVLECLECTYGDWFVSREATPVDSGKRYRECTGCGDRISESYTMSMPGKNSIYIPGAGICAEFAITSFTQSAVDKNDIIYTDYDDTFAVNSNNPFVLGHCYGTLSKLSKVKVGQCIYLSVNGKIKTYEVKISEFAMQNSEWTDIIGQTSGYSIFDNLGTETLHMYTCYGGTNGRWMVLATFVK